MWSEQKTTPKIHLKHSETFQNGFLSKKKIKNLAVIYSVALD